MATLNGYYCIGNAFYGIVGNVKLITLLLAALPLCAQTIPIQVSVNWPPAQLVAEKYGKLPSWAIFGEAVGCNKGDTNITFGEGDVIATLHGFGLQAFSRQDAFSLVSNTQATSKKNLITGWFNAAANSAIDAKATGVIGGGSKTGVAIVLGAELTKIILPKVDAVLNLRQVIQYNTDGLQALMSIPAGRCTPPWSVLFAKPAMPPPQSAPLPGASKALLGLQPYTFDIDVPKDK